MPTVTLIASSYDAVGKNLSDNQLTFDGTYAVNMIQPLLAPFGPGTPTAKRLLINNTDPRGGRIPSLCLLITRNMSRFRRLPRRIVLLHRN